MMMNTSVTTVADQYTFVRTASPAEIEAEINNVKESLPVLTKNGSVRTPVTEQLNSYLNLLRQARLVS